MAYKKVEDRRKANARFQSEHTTVITMKLVDTTDADILKWLKEQPNRQGYIKALIRADIARVNNQITDDETKKLKEEASI